MARRQLWLVFVILTIGLSVGNGLSPLLPVYATELGAPPELIGYYLSFAWLALSLGGLASGALSDRLGRRKPLMIAALLLPPPIVWLMGRVTDVWSLAALTGMLWFTGGVIIPLSTTLVALRAPAEKRGRRLVSLSMAVPLGSLIGGATLGPLADRFGYPGMLRLVALIYVLPLVLLPFVRDVSTPNETAKREGSERRRLPHRLYWLIAWCVAISSGAFAATMTRSLVMAGRGFSATAISSTAMVGGLVALGVRPGVGWLSDRLGARRMLLILSALAVAGHLTLAFSGKLWQFWAATILMTTVGTRIPVASALASHMVPPRTLGRTISLMETSGWVGGVIGYAVAGHAISGLGATWTMATVAVSAAVAALLLLNPSLRSDGPASLPGSGA